MQKFYKALIFLMIITIPLSIRVKASTSVSINDLIENAKELDDQEVTIQGEAIGECLERGDDCWININDGTNAIGIWLSKDAAAKVTNYGNYQGIGDVVQVSGIFHRACKEHGGEADFHVETIIVAEKGYDITHHIPDIKIILAIISTVSIIIFLGFYGKTGHHRKRMGRNVPE
jgi:hypothetical protein